MIGDRSRRVPDVRMRTSSSTPRFGSRGPGPFCDDENGLRDPQQVNDVEMLFGLRHDAVIGGDREQDQIDTVAPAACCE